MDYQQALAFWFAHANYERRVPKPADLTLDQMRALMARLGNPHHRLRIIHVAGSKGKGSVSAMLASVLQRAGYRTGLFTSPHLTSVEERFQVDGQPISQAELASVLTDLSRVSERTSPPTFFELATAAGFLHFQRRRVDVAVLEVGLGGRLDSTNVCLPELAVITSISYDHTRILGERLSQIAREKAGIIKQGRPVVSGVTTPEARAVIEEVAQTRPAPLRQLGHDFHFQARPGLVSSNSVVRPKVEVTTWNRRWQPLEVNLLGEHQAANAAVAVACTEVLRSRGWHLPDKAVADGLREVTWPARLEVMGDHAVVLDCAHNVASAQALVDTLAHSFPPGRRLLIFAGSNDKDVAGMFRVLEPHFGHFFLTCYTNNPRAVPPEQLAEMLRAAGPAPFTLCQNPVEAYQAARAMVGPEDLVCITGSVFLAGEMRPMLLGK